MKERLAEILMGLDTYNNEECERCYKDCDDRCFCEKTADYLIANGVYVSEPCDCKPNVDWIMTNADRIRAMTDEELCGAIFCNVECSCCPASEICKEEKGACTERIMKWLKHHTEVD